MAKNDKKEIKNKSNFIKSFKAELKKVIWPTPKQLFNNTMAVLLIVIITAFIVFILDFVFESINKYGIDKIKESVINTGVENSVVENSEENIVDEENTEEVETVDETATEESINENAETVEETIIEENNETEHQEEVN